MEDGDILEDWDAPILGDSGGFEDEIAGIPER
jgi:hypothetical protein